MIFGAKSKQTFSEKEQKQLIRTSVAIVDDQGRTLSALNDDRTFEGPTIKFDLRYASI